MGAENIAAKNSGADLFLLRHPSARLKSEDAVTVLRNLTKATSIDATKFSMKDFQTLVDHTFRSRVKQFR